MQKIKPEYTPVKRDTPSIEEHETVARKNERKRGIASTARRQPAEACGRQTEPTWRQDALGRGAQTHADGIGPSGRWYCPREASVMWNTGNEKGWREGREKSRIIEADLTHLSRWQIWPTSLDGRFDPPLSMADLQADKESGRSWEFRTAPWTALT